MYYQIPIIKIEYFGVMVPNERILLYTKFLADVFWQGILVYNEVHEFGNDIVFADIPYTFVIAMFYP